MSVRVAYAKRALPLASIVYRPDAPPRRMPRLVRGLLQQVHECLPEGASVVLLADRGLAVDQSVTAKSSVADFAPGEQGLNLKVHGASAAASATCTPGGASLNGSSVVPVVTLNGQAINITPVEQTLETLPTGQFKIIKSFTGVAGEPFSDKFLPKETASAN